MSNVISGAITVQSSLSQQLAANASRINGYSVPVQPSQTHPYSPGTGANQANLIFEQAGNAAASPVSVDTTSCICVDGTVGMANVREILIFNDDPNDAHTLTYGGGSNPFIPFFTGTTPAEVIQGSSVFHKAKPIGTSGWPVSGSSKNVQIDPGANTVPYRMLIIGN